MKFEYLAPLIGYALGSIPFGYLLVRLAQGSDIRSTGSGNIGATNVYRRNRWAGILTLLFDGGKGYAAVLVTRWLGGDATWQGVAAVGAILGHVFTMWLGFRGGKGVATGCGAFLPIAPVSVATTLCVFVLTVAGTRFISLASILATATFPLWAWLQHQPGEVLVWAVAGSAVIVAKHHDNIRRLLKGTESKFSFAKKS